MCLLPLLLHCIGLLRVSRLDLDEFDQLTAGLRNHMVNSFTYSHTAAAEHSSEPHITSHPNPASDRTPSSPSSTASVLQSEPLPPCHVNKPTASPTDPLAPYPPPRQLHDPIRRTSSPPSSNASALPVGRVPAAAASFRSVRGWEEEEVKESKKGAGGDVWMREEKKDGGEDVAASTTNKRKRDTHLWDDDGDRGRAGESRYGGRGGRGGRRGKGVEQQYEEEEEEQKEQKSFFPGNDANTKQPFISGSAALALDAAKRGHLGASAQPAAASAVSGARPSGLTNPKRRFAPPRPINAVPELAEAVPPMVRAALSGPTTADSFVETDPVKVEKLKRLLALHRHTCCCKW